MKNIEPFRAGKLNDRLQHVAMNGRIADDSFFANLFFPCFKLRFDKRNNIAAWNDDRLDDRQMSRSEINDTSMTATSGSPFVNKSGVA